MSWKNKTVLVTGAGGFIGSHLTERLVVEGATTRAFIRYTSEGNRGWLEGKSKAQGIQFFYGDIRDRDSLKAAMKGVDVVFHLAALIAIPYSYEAPNSYIDANIVGTTNVLQNARDLNIQRVIHTSTSEVYGTAVTVPISEEHPLQGQSPYSATKIGADKLVEAYYRSFELPVTIVRPFNTYGPRQSARAVIPTIVSQALSRNHVQLGALTPTRDLNYVSDTVGGFLSAAQSERAIGETINFGSGQEISIGDLAKLIVELLDRKVEIRGESDRLRPEKSEVQRLMCDNTKARELLGWSPKIGLREGLTETIAWIKANLARFKVDEYVR